MEQLRDALERAKAGDIDGFAFLVERFQDMAVGYSYAVLGDFHLAEDAAQEAFMEAYPNLHKVYGPEAFPSWLRRVVFKHCDRIRRRKTLSTTQLAEARSVASSDGNPEASAEASELEAEVRSAVSLLPPSMRLAITLFYISDYFQREICEFLGIPVTTLKSRLHRGRRHLRERMIGMVEESLQQNRPSKDKSFAVGVQRGLRGCLQSLELVLNLMNEPQIVPQRPDGRTVGDPRPPTPTSQTRRPAPYSGPAGGSERHPVFASERMPLADGPARSASLADPVQVLPQLDHGWNVGTSQ